ncbi:MAG: ribonuclease H-like domain-containing protein [Bdellovibrionales bacterium]|nr:ribonuclease H-like domain-containing protein [Bdellovibrionales bacterium]
MLENSFVHLPGIGPETEERLWAQGLRTWEQLASSLSLIFGAKKAQTLARALEECRAAHEAREFSYFQGRFKASEMWRLLPTLLHTAPQEIAYLDIETTGLGFPPQCQSTTIAVYFGGELHLEYDLSRKRALMKRIDGEARGLVTFNGGTFDLPFLRREFGLSFGQAHVDLRFWFARLGLKGGLKAIQKAFPGVRQRDSMDIDGFDAVRLWALHKSGVPRALETLLTYNAEDTVVLEPLAYEGLRLERERWPSLGLEDFSCPPSPTIPYTVCPQIYRRIRGG